MPSADNYLYRPQLEVVKQRSDSGFAVLMIVTALVMLVGATFVGHDWASGSMSNQLLFEPRRLRVWAAKAGVVFLTSLAVSLFVLLACWGAVWLLAESRNVQATTHQWRLIGNFTMRGSALAAFAALGAFGMTMFLRSTVATLGALFAVTIGGSLMIGAVMGSTAQRWLLPTNFLAVLDNGYGSSECSDQLDGADCGQLISLVDGVTYLSVLVISALMLSIWSFQRRDVP
jgi:ABC-2 type transport system permease protein